MTNLDIIEFIDKFLSEQEDVLHGIEGVDCTKSRKYLDMIKKQLFIHGVVKSSDVWVVEFSDNEIRLMTTKELQKYEDECMEFDGFMGCNVLGRLAKSK